MTYSIYDFLNLQGQNEIKEWTLGLEKAQRGKLNEKLDKLMLYGDELFPHMLTGTPVPGIQKLRVKGKVQLRPLLCKGPVNIDSEYTLLLGAKEIGDKWSPKNAPTIANNNKTEVIAAPSSRRVEHERVF